MKIGNGFPDAFISNCGWRVVLIVTVMVVVGDELGKSEGQQDYVDNRQLDCYKNYTTTYGYVCGGPAAAIPSCTAYLTFRSAPPLYDNAVDIGYLLGAAPSLIARLNNISDIQRIPKDVLLIVPVNCSCTRPSSNDSYYYQHLAPYTLKSTTSDTTYFLVANDTYQGLTTCQSLVAQNPSHDSRNLSAGLDLIVPLRCACPSPNQTTAASISYLLTYLVTWGDSIASIAQTFGVDLQRVLDANKLSADSVIYPFTPILVPLKTALTPHDALAAPPPPLVPPSAPELPLNPPAAAANSGGSSSGKKWAFVGVGIGAGLLVLLLSGFLIFFAPNRHRRRRRMAGQSKEPNSVTTTTTSGGGGGGHKLPALESADYAALTTVNDKTWSVSPEGVRNAVVVGGSLTLYEFEELEQATNFFSESSRIMKGRAVYRGYFKGDCAAVKKMKGGDVSGEINILKQINHSNVIRLSGICVHDEGNTYLVYEYAENGSLNGWLHPHGTNLKRSSESVGLGWKQRVQIAYHVADALNYLHNYTNPPYIHKNLKSSNILLDGSMRAKVTNFGLARSLENNNIKEEEEGGGLLHLTRHVVGTQGYMPPEYIENGVVTPKLDVFAFGVVMLELLSGREPAPTSSSATATATAKKNEQGKKEQQLLLLSATIHEVLGGENVRDKLRGFLDPSLKRDYPFDLAFSMAHLAMNCVASDLNARPTIADAFISLSKLLSSSLDWDPSDELDRSSSSLTHST